MRRGKSVAVAGGIAVQRILPLDREADFEVRIFPRVERSWRRRCCSSARLAAPAKSHRSSDGRRAARPKVSLPLAVAGSLPLAVAVCLRPQAVDKDAIEACGALLRR